MGSSYKIGTRDSLLAVAQTLIIKNQIEARTGANFELVTMKTQGDLQTDKPLWQLDGKNFFTKELDAALLAGQVDLIISSYKDLSTSRPDGLQLAAVTPRIYSQDVLLIKKETVARIDSLQTLVVGTSSPRRITNIKKHLAEYLPAKSIDVECKSLRGNVNTRIGKLRNGEYDAIVLALAGLERLALGEDSCKELEKLLDGLTFMVLPERTFPSAPAQGALAIECLAENEELAKIIGSVHSELTAEEVELEKEHFRHFGGGCHLAVGIYIKKIGDYFINVLKGEHDGEVIDAVYLEGERPVPEGNKAFLGMNRQEDNYLSDQLIEKELLNNQLVDGVHFFATSLRTLDVVAKSKRVSTLWVSGDKSFKKAVASGFWVNGSADSLGEDEIARLLQSESLQMMIDKSPLKVLSSDIAVSSLGEVVPCYRKRIKDIDQKYQTELEEIKVFYWTSFPQYQIFVQNFPFLADEEKIHCCGLGKTYKAFREANLKVYPFVDINDFKQWFEEKNDE